MGNCKAYKELQQVIQSYGTLALVKGAEELFTPAIEQVQTKKFDIIRIYAPVGLWRPSEAKKEWFKALNNALEFQTVIELRAVFGLPPNEEIFTSVAVPELEIFKGNDAARLRYLPPANGIFKDLPGTGMIIFGTEGVGFGFAVHGYHTVVDSTIFIQSKEVAKEMELWFDEVWESIRYFQLKESRREITLSQGLQKAQEHYTKL